MLAAAAALLRLRKRAPPSPCARSGGVAGGTEVGADAVTCAAYAYAYAYAYVVGDLAIP